MNDFIQRIVMKNPLTQQKYLRSAFTRMQSTTPLQGLTAAIRLLRRENWCETLEEYQQSADRRQNNSGANASMRRKTKTIKRYRDNNADDDADANESSSNVSDDSFSESSSSVDGFDSQMDPDDNLPFALYLRHHVVSRGLMSDSEQITFGHIAALPKEILISAGIYEYVYYMLDFRDDYIVFLRTFSTGKPLRWESALQLFEDAIANEQCYDAYVALTACPQLLEKKLKVSKHKVSYDNSNKSMWEIMQDVFGLEEVTDPVLSIIVKGHIERLYPKGISSTEMVEEDHSSHSISHHQRQKQTQQKEEEHEVRQEITPSDLSVLVSSKLNNHQQSQHEPQQQNYTSTDEHQLQLQQQQQHHHRYQQQPCVPAPMEGSLNDDVEASKHDKSNSRQSGCCGKWHIKSFCIVLALTAIIIWIFGILQVSSKLRNETALERGSFSSFLQITPLSLACILCIYFIAAALRHVDSIQSARKLWMHVLSIFRWLMCVIAMVLASSTAYNTADDLIHDGVPVDSGHIVVFHTLSLVLLVVAVINDYACSAKKNSRGEGFLSESTSLLWHTPNTSSPSQYSIQNNNPNSNNGVFAVSRSNGSNKLVPMWVVGNLSSWLLLLCLGCIFEYTCFIFVESNMKGTTKWEYVALNIFTFLNFFVTFFANAYKWDNWGRST
eukprot:m.96005 g.96005  ORF g.96005 m.96005 type:complete len:667 (+) comp12451_c0_seq1:1128-3128(+)